MGNEKIVEHMISTNQGVMMTGTYASTRRAFLGTAAGAPGLLLAHDAPAGRPKQGWTLPPGLEADLALLKEAACVPGLCAVQVRRGKIAWTHAMGVAKAGTNQKVDPDTLFEAASISKAVFAYVALQLADSGVLDLDRPLADYLRPAYLPNAPALATITSRHVLTHTSGLPNWGEDNKPESFLPQFQPGTHFSYSGEGIFWLQLVAEHLTGQGLDVLARRLLFDPAGMKRSTFAAYTDDANVAWGHVGGRVAKGQGWRDVAGFVRPLAQQWGKPVQSWTQADWIRAGATADPKSPPPKRVRFANAASSLLTTAPELARFLMLLSPRPHRAPWEIKETTRAAMTKPALAVRPGVPHWWGLGLEIENGTNGLRVGHEGNNDGRCATYCSSEPATGDALAIMTNDGAGFGVYQRMVRAITGRDQFSFIANENPPLSA
jgi:CubicO group peptidase (beta-lactamase class C family)